MLGTNHYLSFNVPQVKVSLKWVDFAFSTELNVDFRGMKVLIIVLKFELKTY